MYIYLIKTFIFIYLFRSLVSLLFKLMHSNQNLYFVLLYTERVGLVTGGTFNEVYFEGCNKIKKVSSCQADMSKLSLSPCKSKGVTRVNFYSKTGPTLPQHDNKKLRECVFSFSDSRFKREDSGLSIHTCTRKRLIFLYEFAHSILDYIIVKCGNPGKGYSLILVSYSYLSIFITLNALSNLKRFPTFKVYDVLDLNLIFSSRDTACQESFCQSGCKKFEKTNGLGNSWHNSYGTLSIMKSNLK